jgi:AAA15 family ATPase/GTPase
MFPSIQSLAIEINAGQPMIYASIDGIAEKVPLASVSGGLNRYLTIAVAIAISSNGVVLVDELENGFYYKNMEPVLRSLVNLAIENNVQLFASTHSHEFLQKCATVATEHEDEFALLRVAQDGVESSVRVVRGINFKAAVDQAIELR